MDNGLETKKTEKNNFIHTEITNTQIEVKLEEIPSFWNRNLKQKAIINLDQIFKFIPQENSSYEQISNQLLYSLKPDIDEYLKINRRNVKVVKYPKMTWKPSQKRIVNLKNVPLQSQINFYINNDHTLIHQIQPQTIHQYTPFLKIDQNIKRLETQDLIFNYNFSSELREQYKLDILKIPRDVWRSQDGIQEMINLNKKYALHNHDILQLYSLFLYLVGKYQIQNLQQQELINFLEEQMKIKRVTLEINTFSLSQIFLQLQNKTFRLMKPNIYQDLKFVRQCNLQTIEKLSFKSFQTNQYINKDQAFICSSCQQFYKQCTCQFMNQLAQFRNLLDFCSLFCTSLKAQKHFTNLQSVKDYHAYYACSDKCYKRKPFDKIRELVKYNYEANNKTQFEIDQDPCEIAKKLNMDCVQVFIKAVQNYKTLRDNYINQICKIQKYQENKALINYPYNNATLYMPCCHKQGSNCKDCPCKDFCTKYCDCQVEICNKKFRGCNCKERCIANSKCPCRDDGVECDPLECKCCSKQSQFICSNTQILINDFKPTYLGRSQVCSGLGLFSKNFIMKDDLILLYLGEILIDDEDEIRDQFDDNSSFYNYQLPDDKYALESRFCGNESRFINHNCGEMMNCKTRQIFSLGRNLLAIYALQDIQPEQELLLNYNEDGMIDSSQHSWIESNQKYWNFKQTTVIIKD